MTSKPSTPTRKRKRESTRILVLMHEDLVPPESIEGLSDQEVVPFKTEYDVTTALREMGHEVSPLGVASDLGVLRDTLNSFKPRSTSGCTRTGTRMMRATGTGQHEGLSFHHVA